MTTTDDLLLRFGRIVRERRDYLGLRQDQVAARGGPSTTTLTKVENGTPPAPTPGTLRKLDVGLGWEQGSATRAVSGGDPTPTHENAIKTEFFSATGKRLGSTIWIEGAEQEFLEQLRMAELTLDAADLVAGKRVQAFETLAPATKSCAATFLALQARYHFEPRGSIDVKGLGAMTTHFLLGKR